MTRLEKELIDSEEKIKQLFRNLPIPTYIWQKIKDDLFLIDVNIAAESITKGRIKKLLGIKASVAYKDDPEILNDINRCFKEQVNFSRDLDYTLKTTGEPRSFHVNYGYIPPDLVVIHTEDITARKQAEDELSLHSEIMTNMAEGVNLARENDGIIVYTNPRFEENFGYNPGELIGKHVSILNAPTDQSPEEIFEEVLGILKEKGEWQGEIHNIKKDGTLFWSNVHVSFFKHPKYGRVLVAVHSDITERKLAEQKLKESEEKYREAYNLVNFYKDLFAHDMNNILQSILSTAEYHSLF